MKKIIIIFIIALLLPALAACTGGESRSDTAPPPPAGEAPVTSPETEEAPEPEPVASPPSVDAEEATISVDYATDELLGQFEIVIHNHTDEEYYERVVFSTSAGVKGFRFIEVDFREEDGEIVFFESGVLYSIDELLPEMAFVVPVEFFGSIPSRGIAYTDGNSAAKYFCVAQSGEDGSLFLVEFFGD